MVLAIQSIPTANPPPTSNKASGISIEIPVIPAQSGSRLPKNVVLLQQLPRQVDPKVISFLKILAQAMEEVIDDQASLATAQSHVSDYLAKNSDSMVQSAQQLCQKVQQEIQEEQAEEHSSGILGSIFGGLGIFGAILGALFCAITGEIGAAIMMGVMLGLQASGVMNQLNEKLESVTGNDFLRTLLKTAVVLAITVVSSGASGAIDATAETVANTMSRASAEEAAGAAEQASPSFSQGLTSKATLTANFAGSFMTLNPAIDLTEGIAGAAGASDKLKKELGQIIGVIAALIIGLGCAYYAAKSVAAEGGTTSAGRLLAKLEGRFSAKGMSNLYTIFNVTRGVAMTAGGAFGVAQGVTDYQLANTKRDIADTNAQNLVIQELINNTDQMISIQNEQASQTSQVFSEIMRNWDNYVTPYATAAGVLPA